MSDVETWSPVDESNTAAPPNGWPEFMMPSGVNNCGRMMMGAVRRMYDKNVSGATVLPYLSLSGGVVTGATTFNTTVILASPGGAGNSAARRDYVDQTNLTLYNYVNSQDVAYYNSATTHATTLDTNQRNYIDNLHNAQQGDINNRVYKGGDSMWGGLSVPYIYGGAGSAGNLRTYGNSNTINFRWDSAAYNYGVVFWRIDETREAGICDSRNFWNIGVEPGGGGPVNWVFAGRDSGTWFYYVTDFVSSDERIKSNIAQSEIDALGVLDRVQISQFDFKPEAVAWCQSVGKTPAERAQMMQTAEPAHVDIGFVAQQVREVIPDAVFCAHQHGLSPDGPLPDDMLTVSNQAFVPYLVRAVQQLAARVKTLEEELRDVRFWQDA